MIDMSLEDKAHYFMEKSIDFDPAVFTNADMINAATRIMSHVAVVRADTFWKPETVGQSRRYGLSFYPKGQRPIIYLNVLKHKGDTLELFDTILHEALRCSALYLDRHDELPSDEQSIEYRLEELCVSSGMSKLYPMLKIADMREASRRQKKIVDQSIKSLRQDMSENVIEEWIAKGQEAANWLHNIIKPETRS